MEIVPLKLRKTLHWKNDFKTKPPIYTGVLLKLPWLELSPLIVLKNIFLGKSAEGKQCFKN